MGSGHTDMHELVSVAGFGADAHRSTAPSLSSTFRPFSSYSARDSQKDSLSFMMLASTAPPMNTMCLRRGGSSIRILNFCVGRENSSEETACLKQNSFKSNLSFLTYSFYILNMQYLKVTLLCASPLFPCQYQHSFAFQRPL